MKFMVGAVVTAVMGIAAMVSWSFAGRLMLEKDDVSVVMGVLIMVLVVVMVGACIFQVVSHLVGMKRARLDEAKDPQESKTGL